jgi:hypothetical protein
MDIATKPADVSLVQQHLQADIPNPAKKNFYSIKELARLTSAGGRKLLLPGRIGRHHCGRIPAFKNDLAARYAPVNPDIGNSSGKLENQDGKRTPERDPGSHGQPLDYQVLHHVTQQFRMALKDNGNGQEKHPKPEKQEGFRQHLSELAPLEKFQVLKITFHAFADALPVLFLDMLRQIDADNEIIAADLLHRLDEIIDKVLVQILLDVGGGTVEILEQFGNLPHRDINGEATV